MIKTIILSASWRISYIIDGTLCRALIRKDALGSFSFDVIKRILGVLNEDGASMKKTNLGSKSGVNYNVCLRYILMLSSLGWVDVNSEVSITEMGKGVYAKLLDVSEVIVDSAGDDVWQGNLRSKSVIYSGSSYMALSIKADSYSTITNDPKANSFAEQTEDRQ